MNLLYDKRRAGVLAILLAVLGGGAVFSGVGAASANHNSFCNNDGTFGDASLEVVGVAKIVVNTGNLTTPGTGNGVWVCAIPPDQGGGAALRDNDSSTLGVQLEAETCGHLTCGVITEDTGVEVDPAIGVNTSDGSTAGTGASVGTGPGTCTWIDGSPDCGLGGVAIGGATINEDDVLVANTPGTGCWFGVNGTCLVDNTGVGVGQDADPTVAVTDPTGMTTTADLPPQCAQLGATC